MIALARPIAVYAPIIGGFLAWNLLARTPARQWAVAIAGGLLLWTLIEYLMHHWIFHGTVLPADTRAGLHLAHHVEPDDPEKIVARPWFSLSIATPIWLTLCLSTWSWKFGSLAMCGVLVGYLAYEFVHSGGLAWWRRNHFYHHFQEPGRVFGVTSPIWDRVFGTAR